MVVSFVGIPGRLYESLPLIAGIILVLIALNGFADHYKDKSIFNKSLYGLIIMIVGIVAAVLIFVILIMPIAPELAKLDWTNTAAVREFIRKNLWVFSRTNYRGLFDGCHIHNHFSSVFQKIFRCVICTFWGENV